MDFIKGFKKILLIPQNWNVYGHSLMLYMFDISKYFLSVKFIFYCFKLIYNLSFLHSTSQNLDKRCGFLERCLSECVII